MCKRFFVMLTIFCIILISQTANAEVTLKLKDGRYVPKDIIGSYFYDKEGFVSNLNLSKYFMLDNPNDKASYFVSVFFNPEKGEFDISKISKGDTVNFIFLDVDYNVLSTKSMSVLNKGFMSGGKFWVSILPPDDLTDYVLSSHGMIIEFNCNGQFFRMPLNNGQFYEWKQVAATVTKVKDEY
jgi:hypothetical protein